jgi:hypothetical protein
MIKIVNGETRYFSEPLTDWVDWDAELDRELERGRREREAAAARARDDAAARRIEAEDQEIERLIQVDRRRGYKRLIEALAQRQKITIEWRERMPVGAAAFANWRKRLIVIPPIGVNHDIDVDLAIALHEMGHIRAGACTNREPHRRDPQVRDWWHCIACETAAWREGMTLYPFTREMFARLQQSLRTYRSKTPAPTEAIAALDRLKGNLTWHEDKQRRRTWQMRLDLVKQWKGMNT